MNTKNTLTLEQLIEQVSQKLRQLGLADLPDRRASLMPDVRMVRYYTSLGLLKPPQIVQRQAYYGQGHVDAFLLVKLLQVQGLSLARIQQELIGLGPEQRTSWLNQLRQALAGRIEPLPSVSWQEVTLEPGLRLQFRSDYTCTNLEAVLRQVKALLENKTQDGSLSP